MISIYYRNSETVFRVCPPDLPVSSIGGRSLKKRGTSGGSYSYGAPAYYLRTISGLTLNLAGMEMPAGISLGAWVIRAIRELAINKTAHMM